MLKFLGGTVGIIFLIGLIVVIALFKFIFEPGGGQWLGVPFFWREKAQSLQIGLRYCGQPVRLSHDDIHSGMSRMPCKTRHTSMCSSRST